MLQEVLGGRGVDRELVVRHGEGRVGGRGLLVELPPLVGAELLSDGAGIEVELPRLRRSWC